MFLTTPNTTLDNFPFSLTCHQWDGIQQLGIIETDLTDTAVAEVAIGELGVGGKAGEWNLVYYTKMGYIC